MDPSLWHNPRGNSNVPPFCAPRPFWCFLFCFVWNKIFCCWFRYRFLWNVSVGISGLESSLFLFIFFTTSSSSFAISAIVSFDLFVFFSEWSQPERASLLSFGDAHSVTSDNNSNNGNNNNNDSDNSNSNNSNNNSNSNGDDDQTQ